MKNKIARLFKKIPGGPDLPFLKAESAKEGKTVWLTGAIHGDETGGIIIIREIFNRLEKEPLLRGSLLAYPLMNPAGFANATRHIAAAKEDLNRAFPGKKGGALAQRMAAEIFDSIAKTQPALVIDIHNDWLNSIPHILIDPDFGLQGREARKAAQKFALQSGFAVLDEMQPGENIAQFKKTLSGSLLNIGIPAFTLEMAGAAIVSAEVEDNDIKDGVIAVWNILADLGLVKKSAEKLNYRLPKNYRGNILSYCQEPKSKASGIIRYLAEPGQEVKKGEVIAKIFDPSGNLLETVKAEKSGIVLGHADYSAVYPDAEIFAFGVKG